MSERQIKVKATYNKEKEKTRKRAISKFKNNEDLTEEEAQILREEIPTEEDLKQMEQSSKEFSQTIQRIIEPQKEMIEQVSQKVEELTKPLTKSVQGIAKQLNKSLKPLFEEIDNQNKENPLTREEIEKSTKFLLDYTKEKEKLIQKINNLQSRQMNLFSKIFQTTGATEEEISRYKLEGEEIDFPVDIFTDISNKIQGKSTEKEDFETQLKKFLRTKLSKKLRDKLKENEDKDIPLNEYLVKAEIDSIQKACDEFNKETLFFRNRPSRHNLELIERKREINKELPLKYIFRRVTEIHFENITEEDFKSYLKEEIEILKELIDIQNDTLSKNREIVNIFSRASNPYFEGKKEIELDPEEKQIKEEFYNTSFLIFQDSSNLSTLARAILVSQPSFDEMDIEQQERIFEFLQYNLEDLEELSKEWTPQEEVEEIVEQYLTTNSKDRKFLTTEKIVPQIMLSGLKIQNKFEEKEQGKIEKVTFDIASDNDKRYFIQVVMNEYKLPFTDNTFKTLESLMTIQNLMEKQFKTLRGAFFSTKDVIFLNRGGRVTNYSKTLYQETNRELISLMSAIGSLDTTDYFLKYYGIDDKTLEEENKAILMTIDDPETYDKTLEELRKEKIKKSNIHFPIDKIKKISSIQPFVAMKGLNIESEEEAFNNTFWTFNDINEKPIPILEFLKMTGRFAFLPLEMDSYLSDSTTNNEVTRNLKTIIANLNYYKTNKEMKKDRTTKNFLEWYYIGIKKGSQKEEIFEPSEMMKLKNNPEWNFFARYKATRTIDSIARDCKFDEERGIGVPKEWKNNKERPRFVDSIVEYLRKAKDDKNIDDFILYTTKDKVVKNEDYITENEKRSQKTRDKIRGKENKKKQSKNPSIEKISIIIK